MLNIFKGDAFGVVPLTDSVQSLLYRPGRIGELGLFDTTSVSTLTVAIEQKGDILQLISPSQRGAMGATRDHAKPNIRDIRVPHFQRPWSVIADEVQGVRAWGSETALETVQGLVLQRMADHLADFALTEELARLGAVSGIVTYADASTLNLYTEFGVSQVAEVDFDLDNASPAGGALRKKCTDVIRAMKKALGAVPFVSVHAFCGDTFFDQLLAHPEVRETYKGWSEAQILRDSYVGKNRGSNPMFEFGGIVFENYGQIDAEGVGVDTLKCRFFPVGVSKMFRTYYAPADYVETVNTPGQRLYAAQEPMPLNKGINGEIQMNSLNLATRPGALFGAKNT